MRRIVLALLALSAVAAFAQAPFTIVRPADGAKVREKVRVQVPRSSVPESGYIGIYVNGNFVEAVVPTADSNFYDYYLDTKKLKLPDGPTKIEVYLYVTLNDSPRIVDRSSITVQLSNRANIEVPADGLRLRYHFAPGNVVTYNVDSRLSVQTLQPGQMKAGARAASLPLDAEYLRISYNVINSYPDGDGLLRIEGSPPAGQKQVFLRTTNNPQGQWFNRDEFAQAYMRVNSLGNEIFGSLPPSFPLEGTTNGPGIQTNLWFLHALPVLPSKRVHPGDSWAGKMLLTDIDVANFHSATSVVKAIPSRSEFVGVEWEMGRPCAKIHQSLELSGGQGPRDIQGKAKIEEDIWFALDRNVVLKMVRTLWEERQGAAPVGAPAPYNPGNNPQMNPSMIPPMGPPQGYRPPQGNDGVGDYHGPDPSGSVLLQLPPGVGRATGAQGRQQQQRSTTGAPATVSGIGPGQGAPAFALMRLVLQQTFVLAN